MQSVLNMNIVATADFRLLRLFLRVVFAGMPNSSGGAVLTDTGTLAGLHVGNIWHLEELPGGSSNSGGGSSRRRRAVQPPDTTEIDPERMWNAAEGGSFEAVTAWQHI